MLRLEEKKIWQILLHAMHELRTTLHCVGGFTNLICQDEKRPSLSYKERCEALDRLGRGYGKLQKKVDSLIDLAYYSTVDQLPRQDKVLVNQLCRDKAGEHEVEVIYKSDIPDYYAVATNRTALVKVLEILLRHAAMRVAARKDDTRERHVYLNVTERGPEGQLTFAISDDDAAA